MDGKFYDDGWGFASNMDEDENEIKESIEEVRKLEKEKSAAASAEDLDQIYRKMEEEKAPDTKTIDLDILSQALEQDSNITEFTETHLGISRTEREKLQGVALIMLLGAKKLSLEKIKTLNGNEILVLLEDSQKEFSKEAFKDPEKYASEEAHAFYMDRFTGYLFEALESMQRYFRYNDFHLPSGNRKLQAEDPLFNNVAAISSGIRSVALHTEEHELNTDALSDSERFYKNVHTGKVEEDRYHMILDNLSLVAALGNTARGLSAKDKNTKDAYERQARKEAMEYSDYFSEDGSTSTAWDLHTGSIAYTHSLHPEMSKEEAQKELYKEHVKDIGRVFERVKKTGLIDENTGSVTGEAGRTEKLFAATGLDKTDDVKNLTKEQLDSCVKIFRATFNILNIKETAFLANSGSTQRSILDGFYINGVKAVDLAKDKMYIYPDDPKLKKDEAHKEWQNLEPYVCALVLQSYATSGGLSLTYKPFTPLTYGQDESRIEKGDIGVKSETPLLGQDVVKSVETQFAEDRETAQIRKREDQLKEQEEERFRKEREKEEERRKKEEEESIHREAQEIVRRRLEEERLGKEKKKEEQQPGKEEKKEENPAKKEEAPDKGEGEGLRKENEKEGEEKQRQFEEGRKSAESFVDKVKELRNISSDIRGRLIEIKEALEVNGRINKKEAFEKDGSKSYKKMARALSKCIAYLGEEGQKVSIAKIAVELRMLNEAGTEYMESHAAGFFKRGALAMVGKKNFYHSYGQARYDAAQKLSNMQDLVNDYAAYSNIDAAHPNAGMSRLLRRSMKAIKDYKLDVELEEKKDPAILENGDVNEQDNEEKNNNIINVDALEPADKLIPEITKRTQKISKSIKRKKNKNEPGKQNELPIENDPMKNFIHEDNKQFDISLEKNQNRELIKNPLDGQ